MADLKNIAIVKSIVESIEEYLTENSYSQIGLLCDENTSRDCLPKILQSLPEHWLIEIKSGEEHKNLRTCEQIWTALTEGSFDRNSLLINLGGGVIGDMGGFVASTFKRGFDFINIPTTLLSQVDASIGGKLGIDFMGLKNHIGLFKDPKKTLIDPEFLNTLPTRELRSGFAEVIKHGLISDASYWEHILSFNLEKGNWSELIHKSIRIKSNVVEKDPHEKNLRKILNFGHTIGHGVESTFLGEGEDKLLHGEAVAIGMICESYLSTKFTGLHVEQSQNISDFILKAYNCRPIKKNLFDGIIQMIYQDKKNRGSTINCSLLKSIGNCAFNIPISEADILDSLFYFNKRVNEKS